MCACVRASVCACVCACVCVGVRASERAHLPAYRLTESTHMEGLLVLKLY